MAILLLLGALCSLKRKPWQAALLILPITALAAGMLYMLERNLLAITLLFSGCFNSLLFFILAVRSAAEVVRPRPFKPYGGALSLIVAAMVVYGLFRLWQLLPPATDQASAAPAGAMASGASAILADFLLQNSLLAVLSGIFMLIATAFVVIYSTKEE